nr:M48 family metalloprotease [uncultured Dialister sp.]
MFYIRDMIRERRKSFMPYGKETAMSLTPVILVILTFIVNFIMDFSFWSVMLSLYYMGGAPTGVDDGTLLLKLSLASVIIPAILARLGVMERFFVYSEGGRKAYGEDARLLEEGLHEICRRGELDPSDYRLYVGLRNEYNAFSLGKSIVVMAPLLRQFPEEELLGVMAHEMGHIQRGHTGANLLCVGMSWFGQIIVLVYNTIFLICRLLIWIPFLGLIINLFALFISLQYNILSFLLQTPMLFISRFGSRKEEYEADAYACRLGLGRGLALGLNRIESIYGGGSGGFFKSLLNDHPDTPKRIERIQKYLISH